MGIKCFTQEAMDKLIANIESNVENGNYSKDEPWIDEFFCGEEYTFESNLEIKLPDLIELSNEESMNSKKATKYDFENCKLLFEAFKELNFEQATNSKLWTYLIHTKYWRYVKKRWKLGDEKQATKIKQRYISQNNGKSLQRNALTGLWWIAYTTYDETEKDKFIHTKRLLSSADFHTGMMERNFSRNREFVLNFMRALQKFENAKREGKLISKDEHRKLFKELNLIGGTRILDTLDEEDFYKIIYEIFEEK